MSPLPFYHPRKGRNFFLNFLTTFLVATLNLTTFLVVTLQQIRLYEPLYQPLQFLL